VHTTYWRCCKSSGAMALEELPEVAVQLTGEREISVQLHGPGAATVRLPDGEVRLEQVTRYPFDGELSLRVWPARQVEFTLRVRLPEQPLSQWLQVVDDDAIRMSPLGRDALTFQPYYRAGGREHGAWRLTWMSVAPPRTLPFTEEPPQD